MWILCHVVLVLLFVLMLPSGGALADDTCVDAAYNGDIAVREQYNYTIDFFLKLAAAAQLKGIDPRRLPQISGDRKVNILDLVDVVERAAKQRDDAIQHIYSKFQECLSRISTYQQVRDTANHFLSKALAEIIPDSAMHIDARRLLVGTPFGGPSPLVFGDREEIMVRLGIGEDRRNIICNPLKLGSSGPVRIPWMPMFQSAVLIGPIPPLSHFPPVMPISMTPLPFLTSLRPIVLGTVGNHSVCLPWC